MTNASKFFDTILPTQGLRCIALAKPGGKWHHYWSETNAQLMVDAAAFDAAGETVYFAVNTFTPSGEQRRGRPHSERRQVNCFACRSFFLDLDVFDPRDPEPAKRPEYPDQRAAIAAVVKFTKALKLPKPWLVSSGVGVHVYWTMLADMAPELWKAVSEALKRALAAHGILFDPVVTANEAAVLRPPGTTHRKFAPLPVRILLEGDVSEAADFAQAMAPWFTSAGKPAPAGKVIGPASATFGGGMEFEPSAAAQVADLCGVVGLMRDTRGKVDYPTWFHGIGVLAFTTEGRDICHEWSKGDSRYDAEQVDQKVDDWLAMSAATCEKIGPYQPDICAACVFNGKITSPVQLGRGRYTPPAGSAPPPQSSTGGGGKGAFGGGVTTGGAAPGGGGPPPDNGLPPGFSTRIEGGHTVLLHWRPGTEKKPGENVKFCDTFFKPTMRLEVDGSHAIEWEYEDRTEGRKLFDMPTSLISKGGSYLASDLGDKTGIVAVPGQGKSMDTYIQRWAIQMQHQPLIVAHNSFGWSRDHFVTGEVDIAPDGSETQPVITGTARNQQHVVVAKGDLDTWVDLVDRAYNAPGQEAFQFQLLCGFAAPLLGLTRQVEGVTVYAHSPGSGVGKTTVQKVALSIWGNWKEMMLAEGKATINALWSVIGAYNTLPVVYDELTNAANDEVSKLVYSVSDGRDKLRLTAASELHSNVANWSTILLASGNSALTDKLAGHRDKPDAEISRLFEFIQTSTPHLDVQTANELFPLIDTNYGHAGLAYARYLVANRTAVEAFLAATLKQVVTAFDIKAVDRYWSTLFTTVIVARKICVDLGLLEFELKPLMRWMRDRLADNRQQKVASVISYEEQVAIMIQDLRPLTLVTEGVGNLRRKQAAPIIEGGLPHGRAIQGRRVLPAAGTTAEIQLWLARPAIREWCREHGVNYRQLFDTAKRLGWAEPDDNHQLRLGTGTDHDDAPSLCWRMWPERMPGGGPRLAPVPVSNLAAMPGKP